MEGGQNAPCPSSAPCLTNFLIIYQKIGEKMFKKKFSQNFFRGGGKMLPQPPLPDQLSYHLLKILPKHFCSKFYTPKAQYSQGPLLPGPNTLRANYSESQLLLRLNTHRAHYSQGPILPRPTTPKAHYSQGPVLPQNGSNGPWE